LLSKFTEEDTQRSFASAAPRPHKTTGVVINNNDRVAVPTFVRNVIDPDPPQAVKTINNSFNIIIDSGDDRPNGSPRNP
jgi:hypothetical protein